MSNSEYQTEPSALKSAIRRTASSGDTTAGTEKRTGTGGHEAGQVAAMRLFDSIPDSGVSVDHGYLDEIASLGGSFSSHQSLPKLAGSVPTSPIRRLVYEMDNGSYSESYHGDDPPVNAVHMHLQENAKVPSFNFNVDRSNSNRPAYGATANPKNSDSLAELFLSKESAYRKSLNDNYEILGSLLAEVDFREEPAPLADAAALTATTTAEQTQEEIDAITASIDPTPWSEIKRKLPSRPKPKSQASDRAHPHHSTYYPYGRNEPLPIHKKASPQSPQKTTAIDPALIIPFSPSLTSPADDVTDAAATANLRMEDICSENDRAGTNSGRASSMAQAVATAAAIASSSHAQNDVSVPNCTITLEKEDGGVRKAPSLPIGQQPQPESIHQFILKTTKLKPPPDSIPIAAQKTSPRSSQRYHHRQQQDYIVAQHAAKHIQSRESIKDAASKKSQYGFGEKHRVPSVPLPPPNVLINSAPTMVAIAMQPDPAAGDASAPAATATGHAVHSGAAYERKKQRAKDARVKLNESIERLAVAISLAGTQSKQRVSILDQISMSDVVRQKTLHYIEECVRTADSAKKWDRPSFVGTAATLVQGLTSQCESLTRELSILQRTIELYKSGALPKAALQDTVVPHPDPMSNGVKPNLNPKRHVTTQDVPRDFAENDDEMHPPKRLRTDDHETKGGLNGSSVQKHEEEPFTNKKIVFDNVAKMLDPISLSRCSCVCKKWRQLNSFDADEPWLVCSIQRYGSYNVRQWLDKLDDGERELTKKEFYRILSTENVMPHIPQEGILLLGDARIPGRLSGWTFLVERSNGETLRSVKRPPSGYAGMIPPKSNNNGANSTGAFVSMPVVELRIVLQNVGTHSIVLPEQLVAVDVSTRRSGGELKEIYWDDRFSKALTNLDGSKYRPPSSSSSSSRRTRSQSPSCRELCRLDLFDAVVIHVFVHAQGCSTLTKFQQRSNYTKLLVCIDGTTVPMVIPFYRDVSTL